MAATPIITRAEYTLITGISIDAADEARYDFLIQSASNTIVEKCNNTFPDGYPNDVKVVCAMMVTFDVAQTSSSGGATGYKSESQGGWSYDKGNIDDSFIVGYPKEIAMRLQPYCNAKLGFGTVQYEQYDFDKRGSYPFTASSGWPYDIRQKD